MSGDGVEPLKQIRQPLFENDPMGEIEMDTVVFQSLGVGQ